jgi:large subunit ribosomal protein L21
MYAIIHTGGKQAKVSEGDVLSVDLIKDTEKVSYTPLLIVTDDGSVIADPAKLKKATVTAEILGESAGPKIDIFKYKNKTGYRRRMGHRQKYTTIKVTGIKAPGAKKKADKATKADKAKKADKATKADKAEKAKNADKSTKADKASDDAGDQEA